MKKQPNLTKTRESLALGLPATNPQGSLWGDNFNPGKLPEQGWMDRDEYMRLAGMIGAAGEAFVIHSYDTPVIWFVPGHGWEATTKKHSVTTTKHINALMAQITKGSEK